MTVDLSHVADVLDKVALEKVDTPLVPLEPLELIPITHGVVAVKIDPDAKYIVFISPGHMDVPQFIADPHNPLPKGTPIYRIYGDMDIDKAIRIYELLDTKVNR